MSVYRPVKPTTVQALIGFVSGWSVSVLIALIAGSLYALVMESGHTHEFISAALSGKAGALNVLLFVGGTSAIVAAIMAGILTIIIAVPLYLLSIKLQYVSWHIYFLTGLVTSFVAILCVIAFQQFFAPLSSANVYWFEFIVTMFAGPTYTLTFWTVVIKKYVT